MIKKLPFFYHPTAAIFVDDQESFIHSTLAIVDNLTDCRSFLDPKEALKYIKSVDVGAYFVSALKQEDQERLVLIPQKALAKYMGSLDRFLLETTLIIDYAMPKLNGVELCEAIEKKNFKKIMLTGEAGSDIAVEALNNHLIDRFIHKNSPKVFEELNQALLELRAQFFEAFGQEISVHMTTLPAFLSTEAFSEFFRQMFNKLKGVEYYLINRLGDFLIFDEQGHATWLCMRDKEGQDYTRNMLEAQNKKKPSEDLIFALDHLNNGKYLLVYGFGDVTKNVRDWVLPANTIKFDRHSCHYATLPVKLDMKIQPLALQKPQYALNRDGV